MMIQYKSILVESKLTIQVPEEYIYQFVKTTLDQRTINSSTSSSSCSSSSSSSILVLTCR